MGRPFLYVDTAKHTIRHDRSGRLLNASKDKKNRLKKKRELELFCTVRPPCSPVSSSVRRGPSHSCYYSSSLISPD
jgi:hypothetical protein